MTYSVEEAADILGVSKSKIYDSVRNGELRGVQVGRRVVMPCDVLEKLVGALSIGEPREPREGAPARSAGGTELNAVYVTGRIARQPALRVSRTGMAVCTLRLAVSRRRRDGEPRSPLHVDVVAFGTVAEAAGGHGDGEHVTVIGRLGRAGVDVERRRAAHRRGDRGRRDPASPSARARNTAMTVREERAPTALLPRPAGISAANRGPSPTGARRGCRPCSPALRSRQPAVL